MIKTIELNLNGLCNLKCSFCPRAEDYPDTNVHMSEETINLICDQIKQVPYDVEVHLSGRGEPTLHKDFAMIVNKLNNVPNVITHLTTNGKKWKKWSDVMKTFDKIVYNVYSDVEDDFWEAHDKTQGYPIDTMYLKSSDGRDLIVYRDGKAVSSSMLLTNRTGHINIDTPIAEGYCRRPFEKMFINWNGDYILCCEDWSDRAMTNIKEQTIWEYYNTNKCLQTIKSNLNQGIRKGVCSKCSFPG